MQNQIYFASVDKYTSMLLLMKLGDIVKVEISNIIISITKRWSQKCVRERTSRSTIYRVLHCP